VVVRVGVVEDDHALVAAVQTGPQVGQQNVIALSLSGKESADVVARPDRGTGPARLAESVIHWWPPPRHAVLYSRPRGQPTLPDRHPSSGDRLKIPPFATIHYG
jgi:hypothetical protein